MYIKKEIQNRINKINNYCDNWVNTKEFNEWLNTKKIYIGIVDKKVCQCSNCKNEFHTTNKINEYNICPKCKTKLLLKRSTNYTDKQYLGYVIPYEEDNYILRNYELVSMYNDRTKTMNFIITEYGRATYNDNFRIMINIMRMNLSGYFYISYSEEINYWKPVQWLMVYGYWFTDKETIKANYYDVTELLTNAEVNIYDIIHDLNDYRIEMLVKAKLYNLASDYREFKKGSFEEVFGINKDYYDFMKENNINLCELKTLQKLKIKNYDVIQKASNINIEMFENIDIVKLVKKTNINRINQYEYRDYLGMCKKLRYDMKKEEILYPKNIVKAHNQILEIYNKKKDIVMNKNIRKRYKELIKNIFENKDYIVFPPKSYQELVNESEQQSNCVKTYVDRIIDKECDIYFMRSVKSKDKSLVTIEVQNNKVVQKRTKCNRETTKEQNKFIKEWELKVLNGG